MQPREYLGRSKLELARNGVIGKRANDLLEEWHDHLETEIERLVSTGETREKACARACEDLGNVTALASRAAVELRAGTWQGRHPWMSAALAFLLLGGISLVLMGSIVAVGIHVRVWEFLRRETIENVVTGISLLPWLLGVGWLIYYTRNLSAGWKGFWIAVGVVGIGLNGVGLWLTPPYDGPKTGAVGVFFWFGSYKMVSVAKLIVTIAAAVVFWWRVTRPNLKGVAFCGPVSACFAMLLFLPACSISQKGTALREVVNQGRISGMSEETLLTYSLPNSHKGAYSKLDQVHMMIDDSSGERRTGRVTAIYGKSRKTGKWEVLSIIRENEQGHWEIIPVLQEKAV